MKEAPVTPRLPALLSCFGRHQPRPIASGTAEDQEIGEVSSPEPPFVADRLLTAGFDATAAFSNPRTQSVGLVLNTRRAFSRSLGSTGLPTCPLSGGDTENICSSRVLPPVTRCGLLSALPGSLLRCNRKPIAGHEPWLGATLRIFLADPT